MTARTPVYVESGRLHVFEAGDTLPPWLSPSSMPWEDITGVPSGLTELAALTGPGYAKLDAAGAWSVQAAIPQADVSGLATALAGLQPISARLTAIAGLADAAGWLHDDGAGNWAITTPTASQVGAEPALGSPSASGYLLSSTSAGVRSWVAPYSLPTATASVLGGVMVGTGLSISSGVLSVSYGTAAATACAGNDLRLSDSRTPTAHTLDGALHTISGKTAGQALLATSATAFGFVTVSGDATLSGAGALTLARLLASGSAGSASSVPTLTWDTTGRLTSVGSAAISIGHNAVSDWGTYINQPLLTTSSPTFTSLTTSSSSTLAGLTLTGSLYGLTEFCNLNSTSSTTYYYLGSLAQSGSGAYYHLTVKIQGGNWTQPGGVIVDFNVYGNGPKAVVSGMGTFSSNFVCYANSTTGNFDFYYKPSFADWSVFGISSKLLTSEAIYDYSTTQLSNGNTTAPAGTLTTISTTTWINQAVATNSSPTFASISLSRGSVSNYVGSPSYGAIYGASVTPSDTNFGVAWAIDGSSAGINGTTKSYLAVNNAPILTATSAGASVTGTFTVSSNTGITGTTDLTGGLYLRQGAFALNSAGTGWTQWYDRNGGSPIITATGGFVGNLTGTASNASSLGGVNSDYFVQGTGYDASSIFGRRTTSFNYKGGTPTSTSLTDPLKSGFYDGHFTSGQTPNSSWSFLINVAHSNSYADNNYQFQIAAGFGNQYETSILGAENYWVRVINQAGVGDWRTLIHSANYPSFNNFTSGLTTTTLTATGVSQINNTLKVQELDLWKTGSPNNFIRLMVAGGSLYIGDNNSFGFTPSSYYPIMCGGLNTNAGAVNTGTLTVLGESTFSGSIKLPAQEYGASRTLPVVAAGEVKVIYSTIHNSEDCFTTNSTQSVTYRGASGSITTTPPNTVMTLNLRGRAALLVGVTSTQAELIL